MQEYTLEVLYKGNPMELVDLSSANAERAKSIAKVWVWKIHPQWDFDQIEVREYKDA